MVKLITESDDVAKEDVVIYAVGRKGIEILERKGYHIEVDASEIMEIRHIRMQQHSVRECSTISRKENRRDLSGIYAF